MAPTLTKLVALQEEEAKLAERRARSRLQIKPGEGYRMLERVEKLQERVPSSHFGISGVI